MPRLSGESPNQQARESGFTLIELLIAIAIFGIISAAAFSLLAKHQPIFNQQQNLAEVNIALRNAIAQMELDIANAGSNYYAEMGTNVPYFPVGIVITNNVVATGGDCRTGTPKVYSTNCFDQMSIISVDSTTPKASPTSSTGTGCAVTTNGTAYLEPPSSTTGYGSGAAGLAAAQAAAAHYLYSSTGVQDQILFVTNAGTSYTTAKLTAAPTTPTIAGNYYVLLTYGATQSNGQNTLGGANDIYNISTSTPNPTSLLQTSFCPSSPPDYVLRIVPTTYKVDLTNSSNPALLRIVAGQSGQTTSTETLATQIIGFKIGASLYQSATLDTVTYCFDSSKWDPSTSCNSASSPAGDAYNYPLVRTIMVSLIGRTNPNPDPTYVFRNSFDNGPYEIQGVSIVVNPRNMSMTD
ncbi:MAG TPA: type II secretion system protein [Candidatus Acidoferrales bacterium]|jgi:prepilin-type N-terminal cleavage/methylation domain-containing protein|nr:type II secretion system protein [Candidatus Acidoferrales bacterium]